VKTKSIDSRGKQTGKPKHFRADEIPEIAQFCRNAKVQISKQNIEPCWGLYNGGMGIVKDIVFEEGHNPNFGNFPSYILVDFPQYRCLPFLPEHPTWVPSNYYTSSIQMQISLLHLHIHPRLVPVLGGT
jgi:hypothetical protein